MTTTSSTTQKPFILCSKGGHNQATCEASKVVGIQIMEKVYTDKMNPVTLLKEVVSVIDVQVVVPQQILRLQVIRQELVNCLLFVCVKLLIVDDPA